MKRLYTMIIILGALAFTSPADATGGRLNRWGCHNSRTEGYHCHRHQEVKKTVSKPAKKAKKQQKPRRSKSIRKTFTETMACPATGTYIESCPGYEVDHVIPLACGGKDSVSNMQWLTKEANRKKGSMGCKYEEN